MEDPDLSKPTWWLGVVEGGFCCPKARSSPQTLHPARTVGPFSLSPPFRSEQLEAGSLAQPWSWWENLRWSLAKSVI